MKEMNKSLAAFWQQYLKRKVKFKSGKVEQGRSLMSALRRNRQADLHEV